jgi:ribonuclease E
MANKMLIDAAHPEETRVVVLRGSRVEEFDFESANKKQLRGNIYLAKVTRVEPSLQAAFIEYGGNRHGFLAFSEIHPDYYQIPMSDRQALLDAEAEEPEEEEERKPRRSRRRRGGERHAAASQRNGDETVSEHAESDEHDDHEHADHEHADHDQHEHDDRAHTEETRGSDEASDDLRPIARTAEETPPYDDPTAGLIEHASVVHSEASEPASPLETPAAVAAETSDAPAVAAEQPADAGESHETVATDAEIDTGSMEAQSAGHDGEEVHDSHGSSETHGEDESDEDESTETESSRPNGRRSRRGRGRHDSRRRSESDEHESDEHESDEEEEEHVEQLGGDAMEEIPVRAHRARKQYKIQEVIKRRQVLLVQVVKEERGNKGAALTTYLSLAGRYSVLMPNTARGGGISRKITDAGDRQRLKSIAQALEVPDGMGVILRTAGAARSTPEVKRDFEYLMRMWETVRETTLGSQAPTLVYEEGSLIKRAIRDLYNKDVEEVVVSGEEGYREAKDFMRLLMPSHAKNVQPWRDPQPIFTKAGAEAQLDAMFSSHVTLKSGGYIVINQTEALVAIDVNSGRSTREHNIEDTALRTNLEAADEVARQLRLRDLAGLIVVDFIDMEENRNNRAVERRIKDALKNDRARIQIGRISHFGLLEMSRQRIRTGVLEGSTVICEHCAGAGMVRSTSSIALYVLRVLEDALIADASRNITVRTRAAIALYILNQKRFHLTDLEARFGVAVTFEMDEHLTGMTYCAVERGEPATGIVQPVRQIPIYEPEDDLIESDESDAEEIESDADEDETEETTSTHEARAPQEDGESRRKRRRRRGRGRDRDRESSGIAGDAPQPADDGLAFAAQIDGTPVEGVAAVVETAETAESDDDAEGKEGRGDGRRRRSRRGGRRNREGRERHQEETEGSADSEPRFGDEDGEPSDTPIAALGESDLPPSVEAHEALKAIEPVVSEPVVSKPVASEPVPSELAPVAESKAPEAPAATAPVATETPVEEAPRKPEPVSSEADPARPKRSGWWSRAKATLGG